MNNTTSKVIFFILLMSGIICMGIPYYIWKSNGNTTIENAETIRLSGSVSSIRKTMTSTGSYGKPVIYFSLHNEPYNFRIGESAYRAINPNQVIKEINVGDNIEIDTNPSELKRSNDNSVLNKIFKWRNQPMIYGLRKGDKIYLKIDQYNSTEERANAKNFYWGIFLFIFLAGILMWEAWIEKRGRKIRYKRE